MNNYEEDNFKSKARLLRVLGHPVRLALLCHFHFAERGTRRDALPEMMDAWLTAEGPAMLEVLTDIEEVIYPVVRPGSSYAEMELGPYIREF